MGRRKVELCQGVRLGLIENCCHPRAAPLQHVARHVKHGGHRDSVAPAENLRHNPAHVAPELPGDGPTHEVDRATLPCGTLLDDAERPDESRVGVRDDEPHIRRRVRADNPQKGEPRVERLGIHHVDAQDVPPSRRHLTYMLAMPRFDDGAIDMQDLLGRLAEQVANAAMDAEADQLCGGGANSRNGYQESGLATCVGTLTLRILKLRTGSFFPDDVIERHQRVDHTLVAAVAEMYATGMSTRKLQRVAEKMGVSRLSKDQVIAIASSLGTDIEELCARPLDGSPVPYVWLDATYGVGSDKVSTSVFVLS